MLYGGQQDQGISYFAGNDLAAARTTEEVETILEMMLSSSDTNSSNNSQECLDAMNQDGYGCGKTTAESTRFSRLEFNATAAALRRIAHISVFQAPSTSKKRMDHRTTATGSISENQLETQKKILDNLMEAIRINLMSHRSSSTLEEYPGVYALADVLQALAVLAHNEAKKEKMRPIVILVVEFLNSYGASELYKLGPIRLVQCHQAMAKLGVDDPFLLDKIYQRLLKPDAVRKIPPRFLAHGLSAMSTLQTAKKREKAAKLPYTWNFGELNNTEDIDHDFETTMRLSRAFMRRLRKTKVTNEASIDDMCRALVATRDLLDLGVLETIEDEAAMFGLKAFRRILELYRKSHETTTLQTSLILTPRQVTDIITSWASLSDRSREDTVIGKLLQICMDDDIFQRYSAGQLELIVRSILKLNAEHHSEVARCIGESLLALVEEKESCDSQNIHPKSVHEILRWPVLYHRRNITVMEPFIKTASLLFSRESFLEQSSVEEMANFLWFLSMARLFDEEILLKIGHCLLKEEMVDTCSPKMASRILATFTTLVVLEENHSSEPLMDLKQDLFYNYGGHLLSSKLSPGEISSALYAYARANYVQDKGVFDHLVDLLASSRRNSSPRQMAQTIWSCGKMIAWERQEMNALDDRDGEMEDPPYLESALKILRELSSRAADLSSADVAQIIWGIGRLEIKDDELLSPFAIRTIDISSSLNSIEISNVLWGIAKVRRMDGKLIGSLSNRLAEDDFPISSPRVAASILFSLGRLRWKDEIVFRKLSQTMVDRIQDVNAQSVANTLWAFRAIRMRPPRELLETWAITRLGIEPANMNKIRE